MTCQHSESDVSDLGSHHQDGQRVQWCSGCGAVRYDAQFRDARDQPYFDWVEWSLPKAAPGTPTPTEPQTPQQWAVYLLGQHLQRGVEALERIAAASERVATVQRGTPARLAQELRACTDRTELLSVLKRWGIE